MPMNEMEMEMEMGGMPGQMTSSDFLSAFIAKLRGEGPTTYKEPNTNARDRERARRKERRKIREVKDFYRSRNF